MKTNYEIFKSIIFGYKTNKKKIENKTIENINYETYDINFKLLDKYTLTTTQIIKSILFGYRPKQKYIILPTIPKDIIIYTTDFLDEKTVLSICHLNKIFYKNKYLNKKRINIMIKTKLIKFKNKVLSPTSSIEINRIIQQSPIIHPIFNLKRKLDIYSCHFDACEIVDEIFISKPFNIKGFKSAIIKIDSNFLSTKSIIDYDRYFYKINFRRFDYNNNNSRHKLSLPIFANCCKFILEIESSQYIHNIFIKIRPINNFFRYKISHIPFDYRIDNLNKIGKTDKKKTYLRYISGLVGAL